MLQKNLLDQPGAFQLLFENHPDGICIVDIDGYIRYANATASTMFGYTEKEILQTSFDQLLHSYGGNCRNFDGSVKSQSKLALQHKKGYLVYVSLTSIPLVSEGKEMGSFIRLEDITKQVEQNKKYQIFRKCSR